MKAASSSEMQDRWQFLSQPLVLKLFKLRFWVLLAPLLFLAIFAVWDPARWKVLSLSLVAVTLLLVFFSEFWRVRRRRAGTATLHWNMMIMALMQSVIIYLTGGIESPILPVLIPMALGMGVLVRSRWRVASLVLLLAGITLLLAGSRLHGWLPYSAPAFFELGAESVAEQPVLIWTRAGVLCLLYLVTSTVAGLVRRLVDQQVREKLLGRQQNLDTLASRNKELLSVSSTIAHELKNPLASIQGLAQLMARSAEEGSKEAERLQVVQAEIKRMGEVLNGFRNFTRPLSPLNLERCDLAGLVSDVVILHEGMATEARVHLEHASSPVSFLCDPSKIKQALINLFQNALEASPAGGRVIMRCGPFRDGVRIEVQDEGQGLSPEAREHLFQPGYSTKEGGSGIGLVVARAIAEQHGGRLELEAGSGGLGCLATFFMPVVEEEA